MCMQSIKRVVDRRTVDLFAMFNEELNLVKKQFSRHNPELPISQPWYAGRATWARALKKRIDIPMKVLLEFGMCVVYIIARPCGMCLVRIYSVSALLIQSL